MSVIEGLRNAFRLPDLRRRILITILILVVYRLVANVPVPGVDRAVLERVLNPETGAIGAFANVLDLLSGGAVTNFSVIANGVYPYVTASIIITMITPLIPALEELSKQGQSGRDKINRYTYLLAIPIAAFQANAQILLFRDQATQETIITGYGAANPLLTAVVICAMTAGTMFAIWLGELVTEDGIGNGLSLIIFAGIVARVPTRALGLYSTETGVFIRNLALFIGITVITVIAIIVIQEGTRRIPVKYGKRVRGIKLYGGGSTHIPLKVNMAGMIPLIFAQAFLTFPAMIAGYFLQSPTPWVRSFFTGVRDVLGNQGGANLGGQAAYWIIYFLVVVGFTYFYTDILVQNQNYGEYLQRQGGFIPGIRPGKRTQDFITRVVRRITFVGALFLGAVAALPGITMIAAELIQPGVGREVARALTILSGGGLIIIVGVIIDTMRQLEAQLVMRHRESFIS